MNSACGIFVSTQPRHWAQACPWVEMVRICSSESMFSRTASTKVIGTSASATICSASPLAMASRVVETPPSTEFSMGTIAASAEPERTLSKAALTFAAGMRSEVRASGTCSSAASVKVPAGPR